jgi:tetratricopeptide (TPR) repeat protein
LDKALGYYEESLRLKQTKRKRLPFTTILLIYDKKGDYQKAVEYFQKAIEITKGMEIITELLVET